MDWFKVKIFTTPAGCEMVSAALYSMGIYGLEIFNPDDYKMPQKDYTWDYIDDGVLQKQNEEAYVCEPVFLAVVDDRRILLPRPLLERRNPIRHDLEVFLFEGL